MKNKITAIVLISIIATFLGAILNFNEYLMGNAATTKNVAVTAAY